MNFKKYHVSKNLFDADTWYRVYKQSDGTYQATYADFYAIKVKPFSADDIGRTFTFSTNISTARGNVRVSANVNGTVHNGATSQGMSIVSFTVETVNDTVFLNYGTLGETVVTLSNIMLNEGSQHLPYEPYSTEVWHDIPHYIMGTSTDTITTLPADLYADGNNATVGLKGNMSQSGTPTPSAPIEPQECGDKTANLFDKSNTDLIFVGTSLAIANEWNGGGGVAKVIRIPCEPLTTYTISGESESNIFRISLSELETAPDPVSGSQECIDVLKASSVSTQTFTTTANTRYILVQVASSSFDDYINVLMLNTGSTALPYEPYGYKIPISSANTITPVYLGEVESTRRIKKLVLTGDEDWGSSYSGNYKFFTLVVSVTGKDSSNILSTHFIYANIASNTTDIGVRLASGTGLRIRPDNVSTIDVTAWKTYLQQQYANGTPVTVWYVLATPTTGIVNEPIRKIGDYADEVSGITIPTITGADTLSIGTTLQPSEVSATYHGWHEGTVKDYENGDWQLPQAQALSLSNAPMLSIAIPDIDEPIPVIEPETDEPIPVIEPETTE